MDASYSRGHQGKWKETPVNWEEYLGAQLDARKLAEVVGREIDALPHDYRQVLLLKEVHSALQSKGVFFNATGKKL